MGESPIYGLRFPEVGDPPDGPGMASNLAEDLENVLSDVETEILAEQNVPIVALFRSSNLSVATNTVTYVGFDQETADSHAMHSTSVNTSRITAGASSAGYWRFIFNPVFAGNAASYRRAGFRVNGTTQLPIAGMATALAAGTQATPHVSTVVYLGSGDYIEPFVFHNTGSSLNLIGDAGTTETHQTSLYGWRIRKA